MRSIGLTNYRAMIFGVTFALAATSVAVAQSRVVLPAGTVIVVRTATPLMESGPAFPK